VLEDLCLNLHTKVLEYYPTISNVGNLGEANIVIYVQLPGCLSFHVVQCSECLVQHCFFRLRIWTQTETEPRSRFNSLAALIFHSRSLCISAAALQIGGFKLQKGVKEL
jgi:hypothetical protein